MRKIAKKKTSVQQSNTVIVNDNIMEAGLEEGGLEVDEKDVDLDITHF